MKVVSTVEELVDVLDQTHPSHYAQCLKRLKVTLGDLSPYATWTQKGYTRNCMARTSAYELILLCWDPGAQTPIHGHGGEDCWVYQVQGTVEEIRYSGEAGKLKETNRMALTSGKLTYMHDRMGYHSIANHSTEKAMTLHLYASPIDSCRVYNDEKACFETKEMSYDTCREDEALLVM